jgi:hypothetical protein
MTLPGCFSKTFCSDTIGVAPLDKFTIFSQCVITALHFGEALVKILLSGQREKLSA